MFGVLKDVGEEKEKYLNKIVTTIKAPKQTRYVLSPHSPPPPNNQHNNSGKQYNIFPGWLVTLLIALNGMILLCVTTTGK